MVTMQRVIARSLAGMSGFAWALVIGFGPALRPTNLSWLFQGDYLAYALGWLFYRNAPFAVPLGQLPNLLPPEGTSVGLMDAIPWLAVVFRPLSALLPDAFHYFGWWAVGCFVLQGVVGAWLGEKLLNDPWAGALVGVLFVLSPPLAQRLGHLALMGHFLVVAVVGVALAPSEVFTARQRLGWALGLTVAVSGVHPYLTAMVVPVAMAAVIREGLVRRRSWAQTSMGVLLVPLTSLAVLWGLGYFSSRQELLPAEGFGQFSADLLALFNSWGQSRVTPALGGSGRQHEGFGYLGLGMAMVGLVAAVRLFWRRPSRSVVLGVLPVLVACLALAFYALSSQVTVSGRLVLDLSWLYAPFEKLTGAFRVSGRFIWPLHALLVWLGVSALRAVPQRWAVRSVLAAAVVIQLAEMKPTNVRTDESPPLEAVLLKDPAWATVGAGYRHLVLYPMHLQWVCRFDAGQVIRFGLEAARRGLSFNSGFVGRVPKSLAGRCEQHLSAFDEETIYVSTDREFASDVLRAGFACGVVDGSAVCVSSQRSTPLLETVRAHAISL